MAFQDVSVKLHTQNISDSNHQATRCIENINRKLMESNSVRKKHCILPQKKNNKTTDIQVFQQLGNELKTLDPFQVFYFKTILLNFEGTRRNCA